MSPGAITNGRNPRDRTQPDKGVPKPNFAADNRTPRGLNQRMRTNKLHDPAVEGILDSLTGWPRHATSHDPPVPSDFLRSEQRLVAACTPEGTA